MTPFTIQPFQHRESKMPCFWNIKAKCNKHYGATKIHLDKPKEKRKQEKSQPHKPAEQFKLKLTDNIKNLN